MYEFKHQLIGQLKKKEIAAIPEVLAFNFMMALIPLLIVFFQILAFLSIETTVLDETIANYVPTELYEFLMDFLATASINFSQHPMLLFFSVSTLILTISKGVNGIFKAFAITYVERQKEPAYKRRLTAILTFFLLLIFVSFAVVIIAASHFLLMNVHLALKAVIELVIFMIVCFGFFFLLFLFTADKKQSFRKIIPGTFLTSIGFVITSRVFVYYVDQLANFHLIYGSLTAIIVLFIWLYLLGVVINLGIQINYVLGRIQGQIKWWRVNR